MIPAARRALFALALLAAAPAARGGRLVVTVLDVGQGDAILLRTEDGATALVDGGPDEARVADRLAAMGIERLDLVVATHPHEDHVGGLDEVLERFPVGLLVDAGTEHRTRAWTRVVAAAEERGVPRVHARAGDAWTLGRDVRLVALHPGPTPIRGTRSELNDNSVVLRVEHRRDCVLLEADAEAAAEHAMVDRGLEPCDALKVAHHGGETSSTPRFLAALRPSIAVISVGADNDYGHPSPRILRRLDAVGAEVHRTDLEGDVVLVSTGRRVRVRSPAPPAGGPGAGDAPPLADSGGAAAGPIDLNVATVDELDAIPGIGPARAAAIRAWLDEHGPCTDVSELDEAPGIGPATLDALRAAARCGGAAEEAP